MLRIGPEITKVKNKAKLTRLCSADFILDYRTINGVKGKECVWALRLLLPLLFVF